MTTTDDDSFFDESDTPASAPSYRPPQTRGGGADDDDFIQSDAAPPVVPAGLLRSYVKAAKRAPVDRFPLTVILEVQPDEGAFANSEAVSVWFDLKNYRDVIRLKSWLGILGVPFSETQGRISFRLSDCKQKPCRALYVPWHRGDNDIVPNIGKWPPSPDSSHRGHSPEFHQWATKNNISYDTLKGCVGIMPIV